MRYWFDTEFQDDGSVIQLISIGVVAEDGREYYAVSADYDYSKADDWLQKNVISQLGSEPRKSRNIIHLDLAQFFSIDDKPEFWAECGEYDWIVLRQLFGNLIEWPQGWPYLAMDIEQWRLQIGAPEFPPQGKGLHNALEDARHTQKCWQWLNEGTTKGF
jgi:hypothetical protein